MNLTVILPTYNPNEGRFRRTLAGLEKQSLPSAEWELLVIDNGSAEPVSPAFVAAHFSGRCRIVRENTPGLTHARIRGIREAQTEILVFSDDDNELEAHYLRRALSRMEEQPRIGVAGGKSLPEYEIQPPNWYEEGMAPLGCRDLGEADLLFTHTEYSSGRCYPEFAPIGAGMVFRRIAVASWLDRAATSGISDRKGDSLSSAGDCDIVLHALDSGFDVAYWPDLILTHLLPEGRLTEDYLGAISRAAFRDYIKVLDHHGIRPWNPVPRWTLPLRKARAWVRNRPWSGPRAFVRWSSAAGNLEGRSLLTP